MDIPRVILLVLDSVGVGELPDAAEYGDAGSATLPNVAKAVGGLDLPNLESLGLGIVLGGRWRKNLRERIPLQVIGK